MLPETTRPPANILLCTLGYSWQVVPEAYSLLAPDVIDLYRNRPDRDALRRRVGEWQLAQPNEIWVLTTDDTGSADGLDRLSEWTKGLTERPVIRAWKTSGVADLTNAQTVQHFRELALRACLLAHEVSGQGGQVVLSLAGGRKTMSGDVQRAGSVMGCHALLHVVVDERDRATLAEVRDLVPSDFQSPLPQAFAQAITPVVVGRTTRSELLDLDLPGRPGVTPESFPLTMAYPLEASGDAVGFAVSADLLDDAIAHREAQGTHLFGNYLRHLAEREPRDNWRSLYRLPPRVIANLRGETTGDRHLNLLTKIPKADLHCHLGGLLDLCAQRRVGRAIWDCIGQADRSQALAKVGNLLGDQGHWPWKWNEGLHSGNRGANTAAVLVFATDQQLQTNLFDVTEPRIGLSGRPPHHFAAYERPGELSGSALLSSPEALHQYVREAYAACRRQGVSYVEWRGSPQKYREGNTEGPLSFIRDLRTAVSACQSEDPGCDVRFIVIHDRRKPWALADTVGLAVSAREQLGGFVVGLDVAGDEAAAAPEVIAGAFAPAFGACLSITIHAGEITSAMNIWQAAYHLHADRIGHGLTLADHQNLATRFRDRDICLELCPSSNLEVVGFRDTAVAGTEGFPEYPLAKFLPMGIPISLCTDNAGTSRCSLAGEYVRASRMIGGLSLWDALSIVRQGFAHAFAPAETRATLMKEADARIYDLVCEYFGV